MRIACFRAIVIVSAVLVSSCGKDTPTTPTQLGNFPSAPPRPTEQPSLTMTGVVMDDDGRPIPNATVTRWFGYYEQQKVSTDGSGQYQLQFTASRGSEAGPPGAEDAVAFVRAEAPGYQVMNHYVLAPTDRFVHNLRMHPIHRIAAGTSAQVTIAPDDSVCGWDWFPGRETVCYFLRFSVPGDGTLMVEVVPVDESSKPASVDVWNESGGAHVNPAVVRVSANSDTQAMVAVNWGFTRNQSFVVKSSWTPR